eukprot:GHVP01066212.1.p1 GENE.GHVP01066212.1~~GHVP01066212.1.p1  ORF type:complete len:145 (-),score=8.55 GHVP01066212.1:65-499(-)
MPKSLSPKEFATHLFNNFPKELNIPNEICRILKLDQYKSSLTTSVLEKCIGADESVKGLLNIFESQHRFIFARRLARFLWLVEFCYRNDQTRVEQMFQLAPIFDQDELNLFNPFYYSWPILKIRATFLPAPSEGSEAEETFSGS